MTQLHLTQSPYIETGSKRMPTDEGKASIFELNGAWFVASAEDEAGTQYTVYWTITTPDDEEADADWNHPAYVVRDGDNHEVSEIVTVDPRC